VKALKIFLRSIDRLVPCLKQVEIKVVHLTSDSIS